MTILCYDRCSTCQKALKWLDLKGADYTVRPIKEEHPSEDELRAWWKQSGLPLFSSAAVRPPDAFFAAPRAASLFTGQSRRQIPLSRFRS